MCRTNNGLYVWSLFCIFEGMRLFQRFLAVGIVVIGMSSVALAQGGNQGGNNDKQNGGTRPRPSTPNVAPEIDARSAVTALALLAGGLLMVRGRRRVRE
jgi:hypothetical protein